jgi:hypothetical protein
MIYTRRAHNSSVVVLLKKVRYVLSSVHRLTFFINTPSHNRDHLEYIHKSSSDERLKYILKSSNYNY